MIVQVTRFVFVAAGAMGGFAVSRLIDWSETTGFPEYFVILVFIVLGWSIGYLMGGIVGRELSAAFVRAEKRLADVAPVDIALAAIGMLTGMVMAWIVSQPLRVIEPVWISVLATVALFGMSAIAGARIALIKRREIAAAFPRLAGDIETGSSAAPATRLLDTSAIIDGRVFELVKLGLFDSELRVPRFILSELHVLADSADDLKRSRGRRGLDTLERLRNAEPGAKLFEADYPEIPDADGKLLKLAEDVCGVVVTVDHNLTKVGRVRGISMVNINEIATMLKPAFLPGEALGVRIVREGKEPGQGVGYLDDGTMVVVQDAKDHVGSEVATEVMSVLQTSAGRMIFARFESAEAAGDEDR